jgi:hypothetical protein
MRDTIDRALRMTSERKQMLGRLLWFAALWLLGVAALSLIAWVTRAALV